MSMQEHHVIGIATPVTLMPIGSTQFSTLIYYITVFLAYRNGFCATYPEQNIKSNAGHSHGVRPGRLGDPIFMSVVWRTRPQRLVSVEILGGRLLSFGEKAQVVPHWLPLDVPCVVLKWNAVGFS